MSGAQMKRAACAAPIYFNDYRFFAFFLDAFALRFLAICFSPSE
jgi:hypothetical protein